MIEADVGMGPGVGMGVGVQTLLDAGALDLTGWDRIALLPHPVGGFARLGLAAGERRVGPNLVRFVALEYRDLLARAHRLDGPARVRVRADGAAEVSWALGGVAHRGDGPSVAVREADGTWRASEFAWHHGAHSSSLAATPAVLDAVDELLGAGADASCFVPLLFLPPALATRVAAARPDAARTAGACLAHHLCGPDAALAVARRRAPASWALPA